MQRLTRLAAVLPAAVGRAHREKVAGYVDLARNEGAAVLCGGPASSEGHFGRGHWYKPTVIANVDRTHRAFQEEDFGPVVTVTKFHDDDEANALANGTAFGLAACTWTQNVKRALRCAHELKSGYVWIEQ